MNFQTQFLGFLFILICSLSSAQTEVPTENAGEDTLTSAEKRTAAQHALTDSINKTFQFPTFETKDFEVDTVVPKEEIKEELIQTEIATPETIQIPEIVLPLTPADSLRRTRNQQKAQKALTDSISEAFKFPEYEINGDIIEPKEDNLNPEVDNMLNFAKRFLGVPYRWGGTTPSGFDCSGFIYYIMGNFGFSIVRTSFSMSQMGRTVKLSEARKGDLMFFKGRSLSSSRVGHVGMVYDVKEDGVYIIHSSSSRGVVIENFNRSRYLVPRYLKLKRLDYGEK